MRRRELVGLVGGTATWPLAARAQLRKSMRRIGMLMNLAEDDPVSTLEITALAQSLQESRWIAGRNLRIDYRWGVG